MEDLCKYADRPAAFLIRYIKQRPISHGAIFLTVVGAVACSVSTRFGIKGLVDALNTNVTGNVWTALLILSAFIACDHLQWRIASFIGSFTFVKVTGDIRRDLFSHLTGHAPAFFSERQPGTLASRVTATSNAFFMIENMFVWNVMPPCIACVGAILYIASVNLTMALTLAAMSTIIIVVMFKIAAKGKPLHHDFADKAAAVDGEVVDLVGNISLVKAFGGIRYEARRFDKTLAREMNARGRSLRYLETLRLFHAFVTIIVIFLVLYWVIHLWQLKQATSGQVILVATLGLEVLQATRDLAVALVDATQHVARLSEALSTLLVPHTLTDHPEAKELISRNARVTFEKVGFAYPQGRKVFDDFNLDIKAGQWVGLVGESGGGKSTIFALLQRFYDVQDGRVMIDGQNIKYVTQDSLREAITVVPQDISLFHRTLMENIRYGSPGASDDDVWRAADAANCRNFIDDLPEGLETIVGDRGTKLSGGQRQRVAIARALLKNAPILILDEATSALDTKSEAEVRAALENLMRGRTVIAIAHRVQTLHGFDRIVTLDGGKVVNDGPPEKVFDLATAKGEGAGSDSDPSTDSTILNPAA